MIKCSNPWKEINRLGWIYGERRRQNVYQTTVFYNDKQLLLSACTCVYSEYLTWIYSDSIFMPLDINITSISEEIGHFIFVTFIFLLLLFCLAGLHISFFPNVHIIVIHFYLYFLISSTIMFLFCSQSVPLPPSKPSLLSASIPAVQPFHFLKQLCSQAIVVRQTHGQKMYKDLILCMWDFSFLWRTQTVDSVLVQQSKIVTVEI